MSFKYVFCGCIDLWWERNSHQPVLRMGDSSLHCYKSTVFYLHCLNPWPMDTATPQNNYRGSERLYSHQQHTWIRPQETKSMAEHEAVPFQKGDWHSFSRASMADSENRWPFVSRRFDAGHAPGVRRRKMTVQRKRSSRSNNKRSGRNFHKWSAFRSWMPPQIHHIHHNLSDTSSLGNSLMG